MTTQRFSDLQDIDTSIEVTVNIRPYVTQTAPLAQVKVNNEVLFFGMLTEEVVVRTTVELLKKFNITVELLDKSKPEDAIALVSVKIDDFEVIPGYIQHATYDNAYTERTQPTCMLGSEGVWTLDIPEPFYRWKHRVTHQGWLI